MSASSDLYGISQLEPSIESLMGEVDPTQVYNILDNIKQDEPEFDDKAEEKYLLPADGYNNDYDYISNLFTKDVPPEYINDYNRAQKVLKQKDRERINYESVSTSEDAQIDDFGDTDIIVKEEKKLCQWSSKNELWHILYGKKGVIDISATFKGIRHNPMVEEYLVRGVLIRANIGHRQYPVECVCEQHKGHSEGPVQDRDQVLQAKPGTSPDRFWYSYDGLRKSVIFEAPNPDQADNIKVHMNLVSLCCDSCEAASEHYQGLINSAGKEASRDWLLVITLERRVNDKLEVMARHSLPCWFKAAVNTRDLQKDVRRKMKGGGAQRANRLKRIAENSVTQTDGKKLCEDQSYLLQAPPEGKKLLPKSQDLIIANSVLSPPPIKYSTVQVPVVDLDWNFHAEILKEHIRSGHITKEQLMQKIFG